MKNIDRIIGDAVLDIIRLGQLKRVNKDILIKQLTKKYVYLYEHSSSVTELLHYEAALRFLSPPSD